ncbi:cytochrome c class I [Chthoniobacter flavus Ellin428]|uniref:Cytochrome c class I n=1 Tax=Chthoniobacter flavus Ellin428 TaxID=497964 RepID=B4D2W6_9BACT|nr:cbb3-type cytochrome c oxidase N-terminal domain-containing protein [Chthoniobacter flavus]EDY19077.1 cytochrome c class I [Chthoniobacter flavus Ellin428]TCO86839.1 cytochrome c oxidase cbb3-type subunit 3 [Chthoniobacter flavus]
MNNPSEEKELIRPHSYDGIQEYDKRLPNWWLMTLWGAIAFAIGYWLYYQEFHFGHEPGLAVEIQMTENRERASAKSSVLTNDSLWTLSRDQKTVDAGKATFLANCASCHLPTLTGQIGPSLVDEYWLHGGTPLEVANTIEKGEIEKGMPTWGPVLGQQKITEVVAFIFSHHQRGEPIKQAPPWIPGQVMQTPVAGN